MQILQFPVTLGEKACVSRLAERLVKKLVLLIGKSTLYQKRINCENEIPLLPNCKFCYLSPVPPNNCLCSDSSQSIICTSFIKSPVL